MGQTHDEITQHLADRWCWQVARRDDTRIARRLYRQQRVDGVYRLDEGARAGRLLALPAGDRRHGLAGTGPRDSHPTGDDPLRPVPLARRAEDLVWQRTACRPCPACCAAMRRVMQLVGFKAQQVRQGVCQRGRTTRQGERTPGPMGPDTLANNMGAVQLCVTWQPCSTGCFGPWPRPGSCGKRVTGMCGWHRSGDDRTRPRLWPSDPPEADRRSVGPGAGDRSHRRRLEADRPDATPGPTRPLAAKVVPIQAHETRCPAGAGHASPHQSGRVRSPAQGGL